LVILIWAVFFFTIVVVVLLLLILVLVLITIIIRTTVMSLKPVQCLILSIITIVVVGFREIGRCMSF
jgi:hypothetical protein